MEQLAPLRAVVVPGDARGRRLTTTLLGLVLALVSGLLVMHVLSVHHEVAVGAEGSAQHAAQVGHADRASPVVPVVDPSEMPPQDAQCSMPGCGEHAGMAASICLFVLVALRLLLRRPGAPVLQVPRARGPGVAARCAGARAWASPPCLIGLGISRT